MLYLFGSETDKNLYSHQLQDEEDGKSELEILKDEVDAEIETLQLIYICKSFSWLNGEIIWERLIVFS